MKGFTMVRFITTQLGTISTSIATLRGGIADVRLAARVDCALRFLRLYLSGCAERLAVLAHGVVKDHLRKPVAGGSPQAARFNVGLAMPWRVTCRRPAALRAAISST